MLDNRVLKMMVAVAIAEMEKAHLNKQNQSGLVPYSGNGRSKTHAGYVRRVKKVQRRRMFLRNLKQRSKK